jgi:hypothetical protein
MARSSKAKRIARGIATIEVAFARKKTGGTLKLTRGSAKLAIPRRRYQTSFA